MPLTIRSLISIIVVCALLLPSMTGISQSQGTSYVFIEDFASAAEYTQTAPGVRISDGQVYWNVSRSGGPQFVYRQIPAFTGDLTLLVRGQIDTATNNCRVQVGVSDRPGSGTAINFGFHGGGCPRNGSVVTASGVTLNAREEPACNYVGDWLWIQPRTPYSAILTTSSGIAQLSVRGVGSAVGTPQYSGVYNTLYVGLNGDGDWPSCSGTIDSVIVVAGNVPGLTGVSIDPADAESIARDMLRGDIATVLRAVEANLVPAHRPAVQFYLPLALGFWMGGPEFVLALHNALGTLPNCLPVQPTGSESRDVATLCVEQWRSATSAAYRDADAAIQRWYDVATLQGARQFAEGIVTTLTLRLGALAAGTAIPGALLFEAFGAISGTIHLAVLRELSIEALVQIARVWFADLGYRAAQDYFNSLPTDTSGVSPWRVTRNADWTPEIEIIDGVEMVLVPPGCFDMGSSAGNADERPVHRQCFDQPFWIDRYEVTNGQFAQFGGVAANLSDWSGASRPRIRITWAEASDFCALRGMRLPTEAEWEFAARGPDNLTYPWGNVFIAGNLIYSGNAGSQTQDVGSRPGGASWVGAMDMVGNVWEWVSSLYWPYPHTTSDGRESDSRSQFPRTVRGGGWNSAAEWGRATVRTIAGNDPNSNGSIIGFRCAVPDAAGGMIGAQPPSEPATGKAPPSDVPEPPPPMSVTAFRPSSWGELSQYRSLWMGLTFRDRTTPGSERYETTINPSQIYALSFTWCAIRAEDLPGIVAPLTVAFGINGNMLPASTLFVEDRNACRRYGVLLDGWTSGVTTDIQVRYALSRSIFDGISTYQAGEYLHQIRVYVR
jgi:hypothetical protein